MHASGLGEVFDQIRSDINVDDIAASRIDLVVYIRRFGNEADGHWRRVAEIHEIDRASGGRAEGRLLHRWIEDEDRFEMVEWPVALEFSHEELVARVAVLKDLSESGRRSSFDVSDLVARFT